jgi:alpha-galactosidase
LSRMSRREFIQTSTASLLNPKFPSLVNPSNSGSREFSGTSYIRSSAGSWAIGNRLIEREVQFNSVSGLYTVRWLNKLTGTDFVEICKDSAADRKPPVAPEFSFLVDGRAFFGANGTVADFEFSKDEVQQAVPAGKELRVFLKARQKPLGVVVHYAVCDVHPVIRKWIEIQNHGDDPVAVSRLVFEDVFLAPGWFADLELKALYGAQPRELMYTGRVEDPAIVIQSSRTGEGLVVMNEAPGWMKRTDINAGRVQVMYDVDLFPFERQIGSGRAFTSAKSSIGCFSEDQGPADPHWIVPSYTCETFIRGGLKYQPPWIYNTWEPFHRDITAAVVLDLIPIAGQMGFDIFTIDAGWHEMDGSTAVSREKFPEGLNEIVAETEGHDMRLGLWFPLAIVNDHSPTFQEHPEWQCEDASGKQVFTQRYGTEALMCLDSPYREAVVEKIVGLITRYHLRYVKLDLTTVFNAYGNLRPGCHARGHFHRNWAESLEGIYEGIQHVTSRVYASHPDVLLDLTFELWGQKHIIDYGLLNAGNLDWLSNVDDASPRSPGPRDARVLLYQRSLAIPTEAMLIGNLRAETKPIEERFATTIGAGPLLCGDLRSLSPADRDWYAKKIAWFKGLRKEVPITEGFFRLGSWNPPKTREWDGYARLSKQGEGFIVIFKNGSKAKSVDLRLPVFPEGTYLFCSAISGGSVEAISGTKLTQGVEIPLTSAHRVEILEIRRTEKS